jgi:S1-C subfamily serine protease
MTPRRSAVSGIVGCAVLIVLAVIAVPALAWLAWSRGMLAWLPGGGPAQGQPQVPGATPVVVATLTVPPPPAVAATAGPPAENLGQTTPELVQLYQNVSPGVVNIQVLISAHGNVGAAAGSGFVLDDQGDVVTNNHVVADAQTVIVVFFDGTEVEAKVVGTDPDSDLAVVKVDQLPQGVHALPLGDSDQVQIGQWAVAIGNPFGLGTSMSIGIVSATGRTIPSGATLFDIPQAIQTDAAINPGNSGGPLLNLNGEVVGVNAQIETGGTTRANSGVGFAIPSNVVRRVAPALIAGGAYQWPWLGVRGGDVNLFVAQANQLPNQHGAYIGIVEAGGPAEKAGLKGSTGTRDVNGVPVDVGGDVVTAANGQPIGTFTDLLMAITSHAPGDQLALTVLRDGQERQVTVTLEPRPANVAPEVATPFP